MYKRIIEMIVLAFFIIIFEIFLPRLFSFSIKGTIKSQKKSGKLSYSPFSHIEFYDDCYIETTEQGKTEQKYASIERISILTGKYIYIHINSAMSYILTLDVFDSDAQYNEFISFITSKCSVMDKY